MNYQDLKLKHSKQVNDFKGLFFAFSNQQFDEGLIKIEAKIDDMFKSFEAEKKEFLKCEKRLVNAIFTELNNYEYFYGRDNTEIVDCLNLELNDSFTKTCLNKAIKKYLKNCCEIA